MTHAPLRSTGPALSRRSEVENLTNLLSARRRQTLAARRIQQGHLALIAAVLELPADRIAVPARPVTPLHPRRVKAA
jgi:hypothetical protein